MRQIERGKERESRDDSHTRFARHSNVAVNAINNNKSNSNNNVNNTIYSAKSKKISSLERDMSEKFHCRVN